MTADDARELLELTYKWHQAHENADDWGQQHEGLEEETRRTQSAIEARVAELLTD